jgi:hypothetical protein
MPLSAPDQKKLIDAGFTILRTQDATEGMDKSVFIIKKSLGGFAWERLFSSPKKVERENKLRELLKDPKIIID